MSGRRVLVTGAAGYIGSKLVRALAEEVGAADSPVQRSSPVHVGAAADGDGVFAVDKVIAADLQDVPPESRLPGVDYTTADVRDAEGMAACMREHGIDTVVHLASIVTPGKDSSRELEYAVDVQGTRNVIDGCLAAGAAQLIVTSSGAAYGYHADNPDWLEEDDAIRGNEVFAYSHHKRLVEEMLAETRREHPELAQLIFRPGTVLGAGVRNQITALFEKPFVLGIVGSASPFVLIWDEDVVACLVQGIRTGASGIYNLAGDGTLSMREIARLVRRPYVPLPASVVAGALRVLHPLGLSRYRPQQVDFIRYRPVLSNARLKDEFGYAPQKTTREVFDFYWQSREGAAG